MSSPTLVTILAVSRMFFGGTALLAPQSFSKACFIPFAPDSSPILLRLFGSRDFAVGAYLWQTRNCPEPRRAALQVGLLVDVIDVFANVVSYLEGNLAWEAVAVAGGGAVVLSIMGAIALSVPGVKSKGI